MEKNLPKHIALIMDGNRRWAKERNLDIKQGHYAGAENLEKIALYANKIHSFIFELTASFDLSSNICTLFLRCNTKFE